MRFEEKKENELGRGAFGFVYRGTFEGNAVAVKVTEKVDLDDKGKQKQKRETEEHLPLDHENVLKLLHVDDSRDKTYKEIKINRLIDTFIDLSNSFAGTLCSSYVPAHSKIIARISTTDRNCRRMG